MTNTLLCATGNKHKFALAQSAFAKHGINLEQIILDIDEIQGEDAELIVRDKAAKAFAAVGKPVLVTDDSWSIPALGGFPGAYMKSMNHWFTPDDFIRLTNTLTDKTIILQQYLIYQNEYETVLFRHDVPGVVLGEPRGNEGPPISKVVALRGSRYSIAETYDEGIVGDAQGDKDAYHQAAAWFAQTHKVTS